jgi:hypothetical protein
MVSDSGKVLLAGNISRLPVSRVNNQIGYSHPGLYNARLQAYVVGILTLSWDGIHLGSSLLRFFFD